MARHCYEGEAELVVLHARRVKNGIVVKNKAAYYLCCFNHSIGVYLHYIASEKLNKVLLAQTIMRICSIDIEV